MKRQQLLAELRSISPRWAGVIEKNGWIKTWKKERKGNLHLASCCVVGEAYGNTMEYSDTGVQYCPRCTRLSYDILYKGRLKDVAAFVGHFKRAHRK